MTNTNTAPNIKEIIDAISDAHTISDLEKQETLETIQKENGISESLWEKIVGLFEKEAEYAKEQHENDETLVDMLQNAAPAGTGAQDDTILNTALSEEQKVVREYQNDIAQNVISYIEGEERTATQKAESDSEKGNKDEIENIRQSLHSDNSNS